MPTITSYLAIQRIPIEVLDFSDPTLKPRNRPVYAHPIKIYQGIDNPIQIVVKNQDQKAVNLTGYTVNVAIQDSENQTTITSFVANNATLGSNLQLGTATITITKDILANLDQRFYKITAKVTSLANVTQPLYMDDNFSVPLDMEVLPAYYS